MINHNMGVSGIPTNMNSNMMLDNFKSMMLTMAMVKGSSQSDSNNSFMNTIIIMLLVSFIDSFVLQIKRGFSIFSSKFESYITKKTNDISLMGKLSSSYLKIKKSSIIIKIESASKNVTSDAIIDTLTHLPHTKCILFNNGVYTINYSEEIDISKGLYAKLVSNSSSQMSTNTTSESDSNSNSNSENKQSNKTAVSTEVIQLSQDKDGENSKSGLGYIDIYSYTMDMETLRNEVNNIVKNYLIKMTNKLGNNIYYFSELPLLVYRDGNGKIDHTKSNDSLHFTMKPFVTNRSFKNLFGKDINTIRKRVEFFRDNKDWYDNKGVPYTLGILVSGNPGSGKTSIIKCISNELKRHIINIHLSDTMTKTQIENLFYSEQIHVTQNGKTDTYTIPIDKRIYVLEDVDCQCDIILDRGNETAEQILAKKNLELKEEIEKLKFALSEMSSGKKMVMTGGKLPELDPKKDEGNQKITLSFLLNLFDGVLETPGRITFMTTNFLDKLDKAFTRPGRIDVIGKFGFADHSQLIEIIEHRYDSKLTEEQINIINNTQQCITPAEVSRILFENFDNLEGALDGLVNYSDEYMKKDIIKMEKENELKIKVASLEVDALIKSKNQLNNSLEDNISQDNTSQESSDSENEIKKSFNTLDCLTNSQLNTSTDITLLKKQDESLKQSVKHYIPGQFTKNNVIDYNCTINDNEYKNIERKKIGDQKIIPLLYDTEGVTKPSIDPWNPYELEKKFKVPNSVYKHEKQILEEPSNNIEGYSHTNGAFLVSDYDN